MTTVGKLDDFRALDPFFRIIEEGVAGLVDGEHFFDLLAEDVVFEYVITVPGYPRRVEGRQAVAGLYRPYSAVFCLDRCYDLAVHHDQATGVVVLEYASQGRVIATGTAYSNRYISVLSIVDRKIAHWRDYLDPVAVFDAIGWPAAATGSPGTPGAAGAEESLRPNGRQFMLGTLSRTLAIVVAAGGVAATPAAAAGPVHDLAAKVAPKQFFVGLVNGK